MPPCPETTSILEEAEEASAAEIRAYVLAMNPYAFQDLVASLLRAMGYHISYVAPPGPDQGVDIVAHTDPIGAVGPRTKGQVKRRADRTTVDGIRLDRFLGLWFEYDERVPEVERNLLPLRKVFFLDPRE